jgi:hypothetical protein
LDYVPGGISDFPEIELSSQAWQHERRVHGKFVSSGTSAAARNVLKHSGRPPAHNTAGRSAREMIAEHEAMLQKHQQALIDVQAQHKTDVAHLVGQVKEANQKLADAQAQGESTEKHKAVQKLITEGGVLAAGAILGAIEAKLGVGGITPVLTALGPQSIQLLVERAKRL